MVILPIAMPVLRKRAFNRLLHYGNHAAIVVDPEKTRKTIVKDSNRGYTILFDHRVVSAAHHVHVTPQGVVDIDHPCSFRPSLGQIA